jgi:hypothetical protein
LVDPADFHRSHSSASPQTPGLWLGKSAPRPTSRRASKAKSLKHGKNHSRSLHRELLTRTRSVDRKKCWGSISRTGRTAPDSAPEISQTLAA